MKKNYWLQRISHEWEVSYSLLKMGYLSIGWNIFTQSDVLERIALDGETGFNQFMDAQHETSRSRWNLWYFSQFKVGDIVVVPLFNKEFCICQIVESAMPITKLSGERFQNQLNQPVSVDNDGIWCLETKTKYDIGFVVKVKELVRLPRSYADAALVSRMKIRPANAKIDDLAKSVEAAMLATAPVSIHDAIMDAVTDDIRTVVKQHITPDTLERVVKWYMKKMGADRVRIPAKNESNKENGADADIIAEFEDLRLVFYIQVKKHEGLSDEWAIKQISEYRQQRQDDSNDYTYISWAISTAEFSLAAIEAGKEKGVRLIGGNDFIKMLMNKGINDIDEVLDA